MPNRKPIAIVGPTASGKSWVAMQLASRQGAEIIACDSVQVYRGFDIGSAKATLTEQEAIPHHLINVVDAPLLGSTPALHDVFDAQRYLDTTSDLLQTLHAHNKTALICGGTGLYLRALRFGLLPVKKSSALRRAKLEAQEAAAPGFLLRELQQLDPVSAATIDPHNLVYLCRAVEISQQSGRPASEVRAEHGFKHERQPLRVIYLNWPRDILRSRIQERVADMLKSGLLEEVRQLLGRGIDPHCRPMTAVGYRECIEALESNQGSIDLGRLAEDIGVSTARYAKRQRTWFRNVPGLERMSIESNTDLEALVDQLTSEQEH